LKLLSLGAESSIQHLRLVERLLAEHAALFAQLYGSTIKPKAHHAFHVVDHMENLGRLLSCWVTQRKHRATKAAASFSFHEFETSVTTNMLNRTFERSEPQMFEPEYLVNPTVATTTGGATASTSTRAQLLCGLVSAGDLVMASGRRVGEVQSFFACEVDGRTAIACVVKPFGHMGALRYSQQAGDALEAFLGVDVWQPLMWFSDGDGIVVLPSKLDAARG